MGRGFRAARHGAHNVAPASPRRNGAERGRRAAHGRCAKRVARIATGALLAAAVAGCGGPLATVDRARFPGPARNAITFWGHACVHVDVDGFGVVTDPVFERWAFPRHRTIPAPPPEALRSTRLVLLSHAHNDHLSPETIARFPREALVLCPEPAARYLREVPQRVRAMRPGDTLRAGPVRVIAVAADHPGGRYSLRAAPDGRALGWVIETPRATIYFSGDTRYFDGFARVRERYRPDVFLVDVNAHLHGTDAILAALDTGARVIVPIHFGAYGWMGLPAPKRPRDADRFARVFGPMYVEVSPGESMRLARSVAPGRTARRALR